MPNSLHRLNEVNGDTRQHGNPDRYRVAYRVHGDRTSRCPFTFVDIISVSADYSLHTWVMDQTEQPSTTSAWTDASSKAEASMTDPQSSITLRSLAPDHLKEEHAVYVQHLKTALTDPRNKNIALTGRYGSGKSSILDNFLEQLDTPQSGGLKDEANRRGRHRRPLGTSAAQHKTLRISISTLGPDDDDPDITNRIQKELVKQLLYRVEPGKVQRSRFARRPEPTLTRLIMEPLGVAAGLVVLLWLFGVRPELIPSESDGLIGRAGSILLLFLLIAAGTWAVRNYLGTRLISHFSGFGATIEFDKQTDSFFDKYLDEIVEFFDATGTNLVVFEDLDRFEDPRIFESLRGLNTLINSSARWKDRKNPLRFIYAIKDSVFERLGEDATGERAHDQPPAASVAHESSFKSSNPTSTLGEPAKRGAAQSALERANRTKFFELVIPVVPFLSPSNAPDLLSDALKSVGLPEDVQVGRVLVDLVARHTTDMRLMINICNEFAVFGQKLLWSRQLAPGVRTDEVFALVVYKNFHPADFEALPHRRSALDSLELKRREIVSKSIERLQEEMSEKPDQDRLQKEQETTAQDLSDRLTSWAAITGSTVSKATVGSQAYAKDEFHTPKFWRHVAASEALRLELRTSQGNASLRPVNRAQLGRLFPEALEAHRWRTRDNDLDRHRELLDREIAQLRGADFSFLASRGEYTDGNRSFAETLETSLESDFARALVRRGFLTRYYSEYSSVFYGNFIGVEVANFFRNCVWPNEMDIHFALNSEDSLRNVIEQAPDDFTSSHSVFNIDVVNYLLDFHRSEAVKVASFIISDTLGNGMTFLDAFLKVTSSEKAKLIGHLTRLPWRGVFQYLADPDTVLEEAVRTELVEAALSVALNVEAYDLDDQLREQLLQRYESLDSFTSSAAEARSDITYAFARRVDLTIPSLVSLSKRMRQRFVKDGAYDLNADNLRSALNLEPEDPITLDAICAENDVWDRCAKDLGCYLDIVREDDRTAHTVLSAEVLSFVVEERRQAWADDHLVALLDLSSPGAVINTITTVDKDAWPMVIHARRIEPTEQNVLAYASEIGVDEKLAAFLEDAGKLQGVDQLGREDRLQLALELLNSPCMKPSIVVSLVRQLAVSKIDVLKLQPHAGGLLAELLRAHLVPDDRETFAHFIGAAGWHAVDQAFAVSENAREFLDPSLVSQMVADILEGSTSLDDLKEVVVRELEHYVANDDERALRAAGAYARTALIELPLAQIQRIAGAAPPPEDILWQLDKGRTALSAEQVIEVLARLGGEYSGFSGATGHAFKVPTSSEMHRLLVHLEKAGYVKSERAKNGRRPVRITARPS